MDVSDPRLLYLKRVLQNRLKFRDDKWIRMLEDEAIYELLLNFFEQQTPNRVFMYLNEQDNLQCTATAPLLFKKQLFSFRKLPAQQKLSKENPKLVFAMYSTEREDMEQRVHLLHKSLLDRIGANLPDALKTSIEQVFCNLRFKFAAASGGMIKPDSQLLAAVRPKKDFVPLLALSGAGPGIENDCDTVQLVKQAEQYTISWCKVISTEIQRNICILHFADELQFWRDKRSTLLALRDAVQAQDVQAVIAFLQNKQSALRAVFSESTAKIDEALRLVDDACKFLGPIDALVERMTHENMSTITRAFLTAISIVMQRSTMYGHEILRIQQLTRCFFAQVVQLSRDYLEGSNLLRGDSSDALDKVCFVLKHLKCVLEHFYQWSADNKQLGGGVIHLVSVFADRLSDVHKMLAKWILLAKLEKFEVGGSNGQQIAQQTECIFQKFTIKFLKWQDTECDPTDVCSAEFDQIDQEFEALYVDWEKQLMGIFGSVLQQDAGLLFYDSVVLQFSDILGSQTLASVIEANVSRFTTLFTRILEEQEQQLRFRRSTGIISAEAQFYSGSKAHVKQYYDALRRILSKLPDSVAAISMTVLDCSVAQFVLRADEEIDRLFKSFLTNSDVGQLLSNCLFNVFVEENQMPPDDLPIKRIVELDAITIVRVNYPIGIQEFFANARTFQMLGFQLPEEVIRIFNDSYKFQQISAELSQQFQLFNSIQREMHSAARPLFYEDLQVVHILRQYQPLLSWNSPMAYIFEFLQKLSAIQKMHAKISALRLYAGVVEKHFKQLNGVKLANKHKGLLNLEELAKQIPTQLQQLSSASRTEAQSLLQTFLRTVQENDDLIDNFLIGQQRAVLQCAVQLCTSFAGRFMQAFDECEQHSFCNLFNQATQLNEKSQPAVEFTAKLVGKEIVTDPALTSQTPTRSMDQFIRDVFLQIQGAGAYIFDPGSYVSSKNRSKVKSIAVMLQIDDQVLEITRRARQCISERCKTIQKELSQFDQHVSLCAMDRQLYFESFMQYGPNLPFSCEIEDDKLQESELLVRSQKNETGVQELKMQVKYYRRPDVEDFETMIQRFAQICERIESQYPDYKRLGWALVNFKLLKRQLQSSTLKIRAMFVRHLLDDAVKKHADFEQTFQRAFTLFADPENSEFETLLEVYRAIRQLEPVFQVQYHPLKKVATTLRSFGADLPPGFEQRIETLPGEFLKVRQLRIQIQDYVNAESAKYAAIYTQRHAEFALVIENMRSNFVSRPQFASVDGQAIYPLVDALAAELNGYSAECAILQQKMHLFGLSSKQLPEKPIIQGMFADLLVLKQLCDVGDAVSSCILNFERENLKQADTDAFLAQLKELSRMLKALGAQARKFECARLIEARLRRMTRIVPLISALRSPALVSRHFQAISRLTGREITLETQLSTILTFDLENCEEDILTVVAKAEKEKSIQQFVSDLAARWSTNAFQFYKQGDLSGVSMTVSELEALKGPVYLMMGAPDELCDQISRDLVNLAVMLSNRILQDFHAEFAAWQTKLAQVESLIQSWGSGQHKWAYLHPIFLQSADIQQQLGETATAFKFMHTQFVVEQRYAFYHPNCVELASSTFLKTQEAFLEQLQSIERSLSQYLTQKRIVFPRFFFLSDSALLEVLSVSTQPHLVERHLSKLTDCQSAFLWRDDAIIGCISADGEQVQSTATQFVACGPVEQWVPAYLDFISATLRDMLPHAVQAVFDEHPREQLLQTYPLQIVLTAISIHSTTDTQNALELTSDGDENSLRALYKRRADDLTQYIKLIQTINGKVALQRLSTVCTVVVHTRDIITELIQQRADSPSCFLWQRQLRFTIEEECVAQICDAKFVCTYEFLGNTTRLVVTPLTDRCYVTLAQALHLMMGGAPAGPAGTGKTETTKDLGKTLGRMVYVFNCSPEMDYLTTQNIFYGLCTSGSWGCFDEFNRIEINVLSVIAMQVKRVFDCLRAGSATISFTGEDKAPINKNFGYFITMNPGYAGRTELPDNLKALFRAVAMVVPDFRRITEIMLISNGFVSASDLAQKFVALYQLNQELLSQQDHYDWGLRAIIAICRTAGSLRREMIK